MKEKLLAELVAAYGSVKNALAAVLSKRAYAVTLVALVVLSEIDWKKLACLSAVACFYIWSEAVRKAK